MFKLNLPGKVKPFANRAYNSILTHKILILVLIMLSLVGGVLIQLRINFIAEIKSAQVSNSLPSVLSNSPVPDIELASESAAEPEESVLGITTKSPTYKPIYYPSLAPSPTYVPIPTPTSTPTPVNPSSTTTVSSPSVSTPASSSTSARNCSSLRSSPGVATAWYSQASTPQTTESTATISIELKDCNDNIASVSDTLTISQSSGPATTVNGSSPPISIVTSSGRASFTVKSKTSGTATYTVRNTTKSFNVTDPNNKHPQVTFTILAPTPTPTVATSPSPSPSPSASVTTASPTPASSPTLSPSPTSSATPTPSPSPT